MTEEYADSTVAMTLYNVICRTSGDMSNPEALLPIVKKHAHQNLSLQQLRKVVRVMKRKGLLVPQGTSLRPCDRKRRIVVHRDRSDGRIDDKGRIRGGWNQWFCRDQVVGLVPLEPRPPKAKKEIEVPE